jgi:hypothetical protein
MNTITLPNGLTRPVAFASLTAFEKFKQENWRHIPTVEQMRLEARQRAATELGIQNPATVPPASLSAYNKACQLHFDQLVIDTASAHEWNKSLSLSTADVLAIKQATVDTDRRARVDARPATGIAMRDVQRPAPNADAATSAVYRGMSARDLAQIRAKHERDRLASVRA